MKIVLISTYELGHQPFGLASPAAWLRREGHEVACIDMSQEGLRDHEGTIAAAEAIAFYLPMHTATRIAVQAIPRVREMNGRTRLCAYGLYAPMNAEMLAELGVEKIVGGEFESELVKWVTSAAEAAFLGRDLCRAEALLHSVDPDVSGVPVPHKPTTSLAEAPGEAPSALRTGRPQPQPPGWRRYGEAISLEKLTFVTPDRSSLPPLENYAKLRLPSGEERVAGYTEASRGCKHLCRHCPIVPVYDGAFRVVQRDVVLADIRQQVAAGARHITFGDPDFFNGPTHAIGIVEALNAEFPEVSYDATIKVEHLLKHADLLPVLTRTNCAFVVTAVESFDDEVLRKLDKGHTREDFVRAVELFRENGLNLCPTFLAFTPWATLESYADFLSTIAELGLVENVPSIQLAIRLLIPNGSRLLELAEIAKIAGDFDREKLYYPWRNADPRVDQLQRELERFIQFADGIGFTRQEVFAKVREMTECALGRATEFPPLPARATIPYLTEPWYC
jgi:radical SAM superfamily enzyme YgiQ (UPF0313 family)